MYLDQLCESLSLILPCFHFGPALHELFTSSSSQLMFASAQSVQSADETGLIEQFPISAERIASTANERTLPLTPLMGEFRPVLGRYIGPLCGSDF